MLPKEAVKNGLKEALENWNEHGRGTEAGECYHKSWAFFSRKIPRFLSQSAEAYYRDARDLSEVARELGIKRKSVADNASHALGKVTELICGTLREQESGFRYAKPYQTVTAMCDKCWQPFETVVDWGSKDRPKHFFCSHACYVHYKGQMANAEPR